MLGSLHPVVRFGVLVALTAVGTGLLLGGVSAGFAWTLIVFAAALAMYRWSLRRP